MKEQSMVVTSIPNFICFDVRPYISEFLGLFASPTKTFMARLKTELKL